MTPPTEPAPLRPPPRFSVVVPYYRAGAWVEETLQSVLNQTDQDFEILLVNDGSPDADVLPPILARLAGVPRGSTIRLLHQENAGPSAARNLGIWEAQGTFVGLLDADDRWEPSLLATAAAALAAPTPPDMVCFDALVGWEEGGQARRLGPTASPRAALTLEGVIGGRSTVVTSGAVIRREALLGLGGFDASLRRAEDFDLWIRLLQAGYRIEGLSAPLVLRRRLPTGLAADAAAMRAAALGILERHVARGLPSTATRAARQFHRAIRGRQALEEARGLLIDGRPREARAALRVAMRLAPSAKGLAALAALRLAPHRFAAWYRGHHVEAPGAAG